MILSSDLHGIVLPTVATDKFAGASVRRPLNKRSSPRLLDLCRGHLRWVVAQRPSTEASPAHARAQPLASAGEIGIDRNGGKASHQGGMGAPGRAAGAGLPLLGGHRAPTARGAGGESAGLRRLDLSRQSGLKPPTLAMPPQTRGW